MILAAQGVSVRYGDVRALDDATLEARGGETLAILGASGSGKSTLVRALHLLETPSAGRVLVDGAPAPARGAAWLAQARRFGLVQQKPGLLRMRAWENVAYPLRARGVPRPEARRVAHAWLERLGLADRADARAHSLSGGEAQRVGLARALAPRPDALLLDEATNQLDPERARQVEEILREEARRGAAVVIVTHSASQARRLADRVAFLDAGRLVESGPVAILDAPRSEPLRRYLAYA